jgi:hypothetical protein
MLEEKSPPAPKPPLQRLAHSAPPIDSVRACPTLRRFTRFGGLAASLGGTLQSARVIVGYLSADPDYWDCNSAPDYAQNAMDGVGFGVLAIGALAVQARQDPAGGRLGAAGAVAAALGSLTIAFSNPLEHCARFPAVGFVAGVLLLTLGTILLGASVLRARVSPRWCGAALVAAAIAPFPLQEGGILIAGLLWLAVGLAVFAGAEARTATASLTHRDVDR